MRTAYHLKMGKVLLTNGDLVDYEIVQSRARGRVVQMALHEMNLAVVRFPQQRVEWTCCSETTATRCAGWDMDEDVRPVGVAEQAPQHFVMVHRDRNDVAIFHPICFMTSDVAKAFGRAVDIAVPYGDLYDPSLSRYHTTFVVNR